MHFCGSVITHYDTFIPMGCKVYRGLSEGMRGICGSLCRFLRLLCGYKLQKTAWSAAYLQTAPAHNHLPTSISNSADFSMGTGDAEGRAAGGFLLRNHPRPADGTWQGRVWGLYGFHSVSLLRRSQRLRDGIRFTVATVAAVARLICFQHHRSA